MRSRLILCSLLIAFLGSGAGASNSGVTYQGRILKPDGTALSGQFTQFRLQLRTPDSQNCLMYEEIQSQDLRNSNGAFSLTINDGTGSRTDTTALTLDKIFANHGTFNFNPVTCDSGAGTYIPNISDGRTLTVLFKDETMAAWEPMPAQKINFVPFAFEAKQVQGFTAQSLMRVAEADGTLDSVSPLSNANYTELLALIGGTSTQYTKAGQLSGVSMPAMTSGQVLGWNGAAWTSTDPLATVQPFAKVALPTCSAGQFIKDNGANGFVCATPAGGGGGTVTQVNTGAGLAGGGFTTSGSISISPGGVTATELSTNAVTTVKINDLNVTLAKLALNSVDSSKIVDGSIAGADLDPAINITTSGAVVTGQATTRDFKLYPATGTNKISFAAPGTLAGDYTLTWPLATGAGDAGKVLSTNGSGQLSWIASSSGSVTGVTATAPVASTGGASPVISIAQATTTSDGYLTQVDWNTFNSKLGTSLANGKIWAGNGGTATPVTPSGDVTMSTAGVFAAIGLGGVPYSLSSLTSGQYLKYNGSNWINSAIPQSDVTGLTTALANTINASQMPAFCSSNQTLTFLAPTGTWACSSISITGSAFSSQSQATVFAGPVGSTGTPAFRTLAATDLPSGGYNTTYFKNGGSLFGAATSIGTNDSQNLSIKTNNVVAMTVDTSGKVGIGTTVPGALLDLGLAGTTSGSMRFEGSTSGYVQLEPAAAAGSWTMTLPSSTGTSGQVLSTDGAGVTSWTTAAASGVTNVSTGTGLTGGPISGTGTISLSSIANNALLANTSGVPAAPSATTFSALVDSSTSSAQGSVLYRGNLGWVALAPGTSGQYLQTLGAAANPQWAAVTAGTVTGVTGSAPIVATGSATPVISLASGTAAGQVLRWDGTSTWAKTKLLYTDLLNSASASPWPASCTAGQGLTYSTVLDAFTCTTLTGGVSSGIVDGGNTRSAAISIGTNDAYSLGLRAGGSDRVAILTSGNVGMGTTAPRSSLDVNGVISTKAATNRTAATTIDFSAGNIQYTTDSCQAYQLNNLKDGTTYTFVVKGTASATCSFMSFSDVGVTLLTTHLPPAHSATTTGKHTMYSLMVVGADVYFAWIPGY